LSILKNIKLAHNYYMKQLSKKDIYNNLYSCKLKNIDKALHSFIKEKTIISKQHTTDPQEFEY